MNKTIKADLDKIVEAVVLEVLPTFKFKSRLSNNTDDADYIRRKLRTALEQFVVEEEIPSDVLQYVDDIMHLKGLIISGKHGLFDKYKKELIDKINDIEYTTPTKGGSNG
jgi:hypothetical protein